jgi:hypothetical protein
MKEAQDHAQNKRKPLTPEESGSKQEKVHKRKI